MVVASSSRPVRRPRSSRPSDRSRLAAAVAAPPLAGCGGVLDPHGPIGASERLILFDSSRIMLVIVVPVIIATSGFAWWFRAPTARDLLAGLGLLGHPRTDRLGDPGAGHHFPRRHRLVRFARARSVRADCASKPRRRDRGRLARLEMAVHLSRTRASRASISSSFQPARRCISG